MELQAEVEAEVGVEAQVAVEEQVEVEAAAFEDHAAASSRRLELELQGSLGRSHRLEACSSWLAHRLGGRGSVVITPCRLGGRGGSEVRGRGRVAVARGLVGIGRLQRLDGRWPR